MKIFALFNPANWLKVLALIGALFMFAFKIIGHKMSAVSDFLPALASAALFVGSMIAFGLMMQLPENIFGPTLHSLIHLSAAIGIMLGMHMLTSRSKFYKNPHTFLARPMRM
jgi:hypothetical protein